MEFIPEENPYFPYSLEPRPEQNESLEFIKNQITNDKKFIYLNLPTGVGKSYLASVMFTNWYLKHINKNAKFDYITHSKMLQDQLLTDFDFIKSLKGKNNYYCDKYDTTCDIALDICQALKTYCSSCPYTHAKMQWAKSTLALTNYHLFNILVVNDIELFQSRGSNVLIVDEAHLFENNFCDYISTSLSIPLLKSMGFKEGILKKYDNYIKTTGTVAQYAEILLNELIPDINKQLDKLIKELEIQKGQAQKQSLYKKINYLSENINKYDFFVKDYEKNKSNWVIDTGKLGTYEKNEYTEIELKVHVVWGKLYLDEKIWSKYDHVIFMSSTLHKDVMNFTLGCDEKKSAFLSIPSPFDVANRPVFFFKNAGKMSYTKKFETFQYQKEIILKILKKHKNKKGIIHCHTYEIMGWVREYIKDSRLIFHDSKNKLEMLQKHFLSNEPTVIVSPSLSTGVSFDYEKAFFQIILKVPYADLSANKIKRRMEEYPAWYTFDAASTVIQTSGRPVRSYDDVGHTMILDGCFSDLLWHGRDYFYDWYTEAIISIS